MYKSNKHFEKYIYFPNFEFNNNITLFASTEKNIYVVY